MNRREFAAAPLLLTACGRATPEAGWPAKWDRELVRKSVQISDEKFDPEHKMISVILGPEYRYHTKMRECRAHPTRDSLAYALFLLEEGSKERVERAKEILDRVLNLQVVDPESKWYGLWGWYMEEPPDKMAPADWNWADFNGSLLLVIEFRNGGKLGAELRGRVRESIRHAAHSVKRRNVSMSYTNIAMKGTFVTQAAAELLNDEELRVYAKDRMVRLCQAIDETGSFAEYNSPTYALVSLTALTRIRMFVKDEEAKRRAALLERRLWLHMAAHWDAARKQFAGPMSRCYRNDIGYPAWLEKALGGRLKLVTPQNRTDDGDTGIHEYRCPVDLADRFLKAEPDREQRELFLAKPETAGTTYFSKDFSMGTVNRGDFWVQRRPLIGFFGDDSRPARTVQLRVVKDGYDFSSALFFSTQRGPRVLGMINFRSPGGDKHISLDPIKDGAFDCGRLFVEFDIEGLDAFTTEQIENTVFVKSKGLQLRFRVLDARWGAHRPELKVSKTTQSVTVTLDLKPVDAPKRVRWSEVRAAYAAFALEMADGDGTFPDSMPVSKLDGSVLRAEWGELKLAASTRVQTVEQHNADFQGDARPVPRLENRLLAGIAPGFPVG
ncbi:hypothetical protein [Paludibaculum fermentans]|uniref:Uncharacterized protein n=1 Tax=Paludibaculum fermentans TaxID=1473598 RepID=A0A7S7NXM5_PALFE|nr:hypothetical protein [Paludibaculum fermentans]QOY91696.1 hypothetical protein IRI77_17650 [Paludibaculum fermentans]